jgi:hypothetical protein
MSYVDNHMIVLLFSWLIFQLRKLIKGKLDFPTTKVSGRNSLYQRTDLFFDWRRSGPGKCRVSESTVVSLPGLRKCRFDLPGQPGAARDCHPLSPDHPAQAS